MPNNPVRIEKIDTPALDPVVGQLVLAATGVAEPLSDTLVPLPGGLVYICAHEDNVAAVVAGGANVSNEHDGLGNGIGIPPGQCRPVFSRDLRRVYVNGTQNDWVDFTAG
jgi:hypothetical protein